MSAAATPGESCQEGTRFVVSYYYGLFVRYFNFVSEALHVGDPSCSMHLAPHGHMSYFLQVSWTWWLICTPYITAKWMHDASIADLKTGLQADNIRQTVADAHN